MIENDSCAGKSMDSIATMEHLLNSLKNEILGIKEAVTRVTNLKNRVHNDPSPEKSTEKLRPSTEGMGYLGVLETRISEITVLNSEMHSILNNLEKLI